jgi:hypothetical protein
MGLAVDQSVKPCCDAPKSRAYAATWVSLAAGSDPTMPARIISIPASAVCTGRQLQWQRGHRNPVHR